MNFYPIHHMKKKRRQNWAVELWQAWLCILQDLWGIKTSMCNIWKVYKKEEDDTFRYDENDMIWWECTRYDTFNENYAIILSAGCLSHYPFIYYCLVIFLWLLIVFVFSLSSDIHPIFFLFLPTLIHSFLSSSLPIFLPSFVPTSFPSSLPSYLPSFLLSFHFLFFPSFFPLLLPSYLNFLKNFLQGC